MGEEKKSAGFAYSALCIIRREKDPVGEDRLGKTQEEGTKSMARSGVAAAASGDDKRPTPEVDVSQKTPIVPRSCKEKHTRRDSVESGLDKPYRSAFNHHYASSSCSRGFRNRRIDVGLAPLERSAGTLSQEWVNKRGKQTSGDRPKRKKIYNPQWFSKRSGSNPASAQIVVGFPLLRRSVGSWPGRMAAAGNGANAEHRSNSWKATLQRCVEASLDVNCLHVQGEEKEERKKMVLGEPSDP